MFLGGLHRVAEVKAEIFPEGEGSCSFIKLLCNVIVEDTSKNGIGSRIWGYVNSKSRSKFAFEAYVLNS